MLGTVDAYVLSQGTTYFWDTCACQAILKGIGGNIWNYENAMRGQLVEIIYHEKKGFSDIKPYCNQFGIVACRNHNIARRIIEVLQWLILQEYSYLNFEELT